MIKIKTVALLTTLASMGSTILLSGCGEAKDLSNITYNELLEDNDVKDNTLLDEKKNNNYFTIDGINYIEAADQLVRNINIAKELDKVDFKDTKELNNKLTDVEKEEALNYSLVQITGMIGVLNEKADSLKDLEHQLKLYQKLDYLKDYCKEYIEKHGRNITLKVMKESVKASIADDLGDSLELIDNIKIPEKSKIDNLDIRVLINGDRYNVEKNSITSKTIDYIYAIQRAENISGEQEYNTYLKGIDLAKKMTVAGVDIIDSNINNVYNEEEIINKYSKK